MALLGAVEHHPDTQRCLTKGEVAAGLAFQDLENTMPGMYYCTCVNIDVSSSQASSLGSNVFFWGQLIVHYQAL